MTWWLDISAMTEAISTKARRSLSSALRAQKPSTLYMITTAQNSERLLSILSDRVEDIVADNVTLAHARIAVSKFLVKEITYVLQRLDSHAAYFRVEAAEVQNRLPSFWQQLIRLQSPALLARAEQYEQKVSAIRLVQCVLHQFVGLHMEAIDDIQCSLDSQRPDDLARAIVASCRQSSSFINAVSQSSSNSDLVAQVGDAVRSSIGASPRRDVSDQAHVAGQLGQFWNQNRAAMSSTQRIHSHDVRLTLQILQRELVDLRRMRSRLRRATQRGLSQPWDFQRRPLRYFGLGSITVAASRTALVHSRFLGGTGMLEDNALQYAKTTQAFIAQSVVEPVTRFYNQVFTVSPVSASAESVAESRSSFTDMLVDFTERNLSHDLEAKELAEDGSMKAVMDLILEQARNPIKNAVRGSLGQAMFLQVQKLKCDVEELMLKTKQLIRAQELNLALVALVPSLLIATAVTYMISTASIQWRSRHMDMVVSSTQTARFLLGDLHSTLLTAESSGRVDSRTIEGVLRHVQLIGKIHVKACELEELLARGLVRAPRKVLVRFSDDLDLVRANNISFHDRRKHIDRMLQCYPFLHGS